MKTILIGSQTFAQGSSRCVVKAFKQGPDGSGWYVSNLFRALPDPVTVSSVTASSDGIRSNGEWKRVNYSGEHDSSMLLELHYYGRNGRTRPFADAKLLLMLSAHAPVINVQVELCISGGKAREQRMTLFHGNAYVIKAEHFPLVGFPVKKTLVDTYYSDEEVGRVFDVRRVGGGSVYPDGFMAKTAEGVRPLENKVRRRSMRVPRQPR